MSGENKDAKLSLTVLLNKEKNKLLYAVADSHYVDILLSFLTLPLGRIIRILKNHFKDDEIPTIGSLNSLHNSLENLDSDNFVTEAAKETLLNPTSSSEYQYGKLKMDFSDSPLADYFFCSKCSYYDNKVEKCPFCKGEMSKKGVDEKRCESDALSDGVFTKREASFVISDDLCIFPNEARLMEIIGFLGVADEDKAAEAINVEFGLNEIMKLLKASLTSPTPLTDVILNKTTQRNISTTIDSHHTSKENPNSLNLTLKLIIQKSTGKLLYAQAKEDFVEFLFSLLFLPLGRVGNLLGGNTCLKALNNLYKSTTHLIDDKYYKSRFTNKKLMEPNVPHGCIGKNYMLPISQDYFTFHSVDGIPWFSSDKFPEGEGRYLKRARTYEVKDDLSVVPACFVSLLSRLKEKKILLSDVKEMEMKIGLKEALSILKGTLTSTCVLSESLLAHMANKQPKKGISV